LNAVEISEKIKIDAGCRWDAMLNNGETVIVPGVGGRPPTSIPRTQIYKILYILVQRWRDFINTST